ncbi:unnamed protein product [Spirodela intermedia]|uniref:Uncharacterized protein n=1 Tax=Spirodela intermedia TaxID=51605 RepID=A0A7I8KLT7_SPIIN|nr:unnamed protein product [Spirodela intermedia]
MINGSDRHQLVGSSFSRRRSLASLLVKSRRTSFPSPGSIPRPVISFFSPCLDPSPPSASVSPILRLLPPVPSLVHRHYIRSLSTSATNNFHDCGDLSGLRQCPTWNIVLKNLANSGLYERVLSIFYLMRQSGVQPDHHTFPAINRAVASLPGHIHFGEAVHSLCVKMGLGLDLYFCNTMIEVYARQGRIGAARLLFDEMPVRDVVSWTSLISGLSRSGKAFDSLILFQEMLMAGFRPNSVTMLVLLRACSVADHILLVKQLHGFSIKGGLFNTESVQNSVMAALGRIGLLEEVELVFNTVGERSLLAWNTMISGYSSAGDAPKVAEAFNKMRTELVPSPETFTLVVSACTKNREMLLGEAIHGYALKLAPIDDILQACLLDLYIKCGESVAAVRLFEEAREKNFDLWSTMISGLVHNGRSNEAADLFREMQICGAELGADILGSILHVCSNVGSLRSGREVHGFLMRNSWCGAADQTILETSILSMYARCGSLNLAERCFDQILVKDLVAWSSMIEGYAVHGLGHLALNLFHRMISEGGVRPNGITFLSVLSACSHAGLVADGCQVFLSMAGEFGVEPELAHYTCVVDLLGRAGRLQEALGVIRGMKVPVGDGRIWGSLLSSCRTHRAANLAAYAAQKVLEFEPDNAGYEVALCNIYAAAGRWGEAAEARKASVKEPGWSSVEVGSRQRRFVAGIAALE